MVRDQYPRKTACLPFLHYQTQSGEKVFSVSVTLEYLSSFYPPDDDMMQSPGSIQPWSSRHVLLLPLSSTLVKLFNRFNYVPFLRPKQFSESRIEEPSKENVITLFYLFASQPD